jgi:hypothetical protein
VAIEITLAERAKRIAEAVYREEASEETVDTKRAKEIDDALWDIESAIDAADSAYRQLDRLLKRHKIIT